MWGRRVLNPKAVVKANAEEKVALTGVKQTASNAVNVTFNKDASKDVTKDNITIKSVDGAVELSVKDVKFTADGKSATITVFGNFTNGTEYNVSYDSVDKAFTASVGAVASIAIHTVQAQQNVDTPIEFSLFDAAGIDVTPSISLDTNVYVSVTGSYSSADVSKASAAKIIMTNVGDTAEVTVTYNTNGKDSADVVGKQTITCVDAKAILGNKLFAVTKDINKNSTCAKFYLGLSDSVAKIALDANSTIYFCAKDEKGDVIKYDSYEVESSNNNIVNASIANNNGKFAQIEATANTIGNAQLNVTAYNNGKATYYTIPVITYKAGVPVKMTLGIDRPTMSDSDDTDYRGIVTAELWDADGNAVDANFTAKVVENSASNPIRLVTDAAIGKKATFGVTANGATAMTYTIEVTGADNKDYTTPFTRRVNVTVKALPDMLKNITYNIELDKNALDVSKKESVTAKLYATCNGLFAGYVDMANARMIGGKPVNADEQLKAVTASAIFGTEVFGTSGNLVSKSAPIAVSGKAIVKYDSVIDSGDSIVDTATEVAKYGNYTIKFQYRKSAASAKEETKTTSVSVKNSYPMPTVKVLSTKVDSLNNAQIIADAHLTTNVDMNNDVSEHVSIRDLYTDDASHNKVIAVPDSKNTKIVAKYAQVEDTIGSDTWYFYVPIYTTFTLR